MTNVSRETQHKLDQFKALVVAANDTQNLVSPASIADFDTRHIADGLSLPSWASPARGAM